MQELENKMKLVTQQAMQQTAQLQITLMNFNNNYGPHQMNQNPNFNQQNMYGNQNQIGNQSFNPVFNQYQHFDNKNGLPNGVAYNNNYQNKYFNGVPNNNNHNINNYK